MEADLDYFDMLFMSLMSRLTMKADPRPSEQLSLEETWPRCARPGSAGAG